ncbi:MAG: sigma-70 family RNA polymerase sigma factor [Gammaproteobacteria bacterium]|nr:sigma-70 family RNA polymerase sigma factor [Gammaproteobacteria bacterium]MBU1646962.1 sigma-70 family RNA polymerase sigma factor [Gammaproteobacteria bacterium]MBU1972474.1 sigma-70 family RNA polymerase sigma factor [Gammaproteobacteria bacterium]
MEFMNLFSKRREHDQLEQQRRRLYRIAYSWCHDGSLAEDLVQETLIRALERASQLRDPERLPAWLAAILANCWRDHLRRLKPTDDIAELEESLFDDEAHSPERSAECNQLVKRVRDEIAALPVGQRQVLTLVDLEEFSYADVAGILEIPVGTVMSRLCRARQALKGRLQAARERAAAPALRSVK